MALPAGTELANFEIVRLLGAGGMGEVYLARDRRLDRHVAVKVLPVEVTTDSHRLARFEQEARAASALNHPNICHIYESARRGRPALTSRWSTSRARRCAQRLKRGAAELREALEIAHADRRRARRRARRRHRASRHQARERDDPPRRLRQGARLRPGQARAVGDGGRRRTGPPEPWRTDPGIVDRHGRLHVAGAGARPRGRCAHGHLGLGVVLYEMVAGRAPFTGATGSDVLVAILDREPAPLARGRAGGPRPNCSASSARRCARIPSGAIRS